MQRCLGELRVLAVEWPSLARKRLCNTLHKMNRNKKQETSQQITKQQCIRIEQMNCEALVVIHCRRWCITTPICFGSMYTLYRSTVYIQRIHYGFGAVEFNRKKNYSIEHKTLFRSLSSVNYTEHWNTVTTARINSGSRNIYLFARSNQTHHIFIAMNFNACARSIYIYSVPLPVIYR